MIERKGASGHSSHHRRTMDSTPKEPEIKTEAAPKKTKSHEPITKTVIMGRNRGAVLRLQQDYKNLKRDPVPYINAEPLPWNILEWHYVITGPENSPYVGGYYHGTLVFTQQYPFKPPSIYMRTPNGRFQTNRRLCLSISDYHPDEWNPAWSVSSILTGLLSFMLESSRALGTVETTKYEKIKFARDSLAFNLNDNNFKTLFPEMCDEIEEKLRKRQEAAIAAHNDESKKSANAAENLLDESSEMIRSNHLANQLNYDSGYGNLILIICFCLVALIIHHVYNTKMIND